MVCCSEITFSVKTWHWLEQFFKQRNCIKQCFLFPTNIQQNIQNKIYWKHLQHLHLVPEKKCYDLINYINGYSLRWELSACVWWKGWHTQLSGSSIPFFQNGAIMQYEGRLVIIYCSAGSWFFQNGAIMQHEGRLVLIYCSAGSWFFSHKQWVVCAGDPLEYKHKFFVEYIRPSSFVLLLF